jgi:beta-N-acetylhexosaminidase
VNDSPESANPFSCIINAIVTLEELIGSRLVFGVPGTSITPQDIQQFKDTHAGGLILYRINFESPDQVRKLISDLENALGRKLLVSCDHEGGRVIMFRDGVTVFPSNQALGKTGNTQFARLQGEQEGRELRRLGIDVNFAPVLDVLTEAYSPNIGIRSYGSDPDLVAKMGAARISAMQVEGVSACAKHFPGLGPATLDPHLKLPTIQATWEDVEKKHYVPFSRAMRTAVHSIMTSHPLYPQLDPTPKTPATFSRKIVHDYLRKGTGYKGVIFSDDLEMGAITELCSIGEAAVKTVEAGHDMLLACHNPQAQKEVYTALLEAYQSNRLPKKELEESCARVESLKSKRQERFTSQPATELRAQKEKADAQATVKQIVDLSVTVLKQGPTPIPAASAAVIFPRLSALADKIMIEEAQLNETMWLTSLFTETGASRPTTSLYDLEVTSEQQASASSAAAEAEQTVLFLFDAHMYPAQKALLEAVQKAAKKLTVVLLRDVYDAEYVQDGVLCLTNYGFRTCDISAVLRKLYSQAPVPIP